MMSANNERLISRATYAESVRKMLRQQVGRGKRWSVHEASEGTGVPERLIEAAMAGCLSTDHRALSGEDMFSLLRFLGVPAQNIMLALVDSLALPRSGTGTVIPTALIVSTSEATTAAALRAQDGFNHTELLELAPFADRLVEIWTPMTSKAKG